MPWWPICISPDENLSKMGNELLWYITITEKWIKFFRLNLQLKILKFFGKKQR